MTLGLLLTSFGLGLRHGIDWDHIAAIADLSSTAESRRRGFMLSFVYAAGHGVVVIVLGLAAIMFGASLPEGSDVWMGRVVGVTLVALGSWVLIELVRKGRDFRLRSRWILVLGGTFSGLRRVRQATARRWLSIEHDHEHPHETPDPAIADDDASTDHDAAQAHDHAHVVDLSETAKPDDPVIDLDEVATPVGATAAVGQDASMLTRRAGRLRRWRSNIHGGGHSHGHTHSHSHSHRHETVLSDSTAGTGNGTAAGIGLLHGVGFESPTQIAVFVASTSVVGVWAGVGLLVAWVLGLIIANSALAVLAAYGLLGAERNFTIYATVAVIVGVASIAVGVLALIGYDGLPTIT